VYPREHGRCEGFEPPHQPRINKGYLAPQASLERERAMNTVIWKCEQYIAGKLHEKTIFESEQQARDFARKLYDVRPDTILRIEPMPIQHVWN
jgi:hypothetical protein